MESKTRMIDDFEKYHSLALYSLIQKNDFEVRVNKMEFSKCAFSINEKTGLYIKHSSSRLSPWNFGFRGIDYLVLSEIESRAKNSYVALVCGFIGLVVLSFEELNTLTGLFDDPEINCRVTVRTKRGGSWDITGNDGELKRMKHKTDPWRDTILR
jgi:hypothetical protein